MNIKKVIYLGWGWGEWGNHSNFFVEVQLQYLLGYSSNIHTFMPSIIININFSIIQLLIFL